MENQLGSSLILPPAKDRWLVMQNMTGTILYGIKRKVLLYLHFLGNWKGECHKSRHSQLLVLESRNTFEKDLYHCIIVCVFYVVRKPEDAFGNILVYMIVLCPMCLC